MFNWLEQEISVIKTPRFHVIDGPANPRLRDAVTRSIIPLPDSYKEFVLKFGNAKLYRNASNGIYRIGVFAGPRKSTLEGGGNIYHRGFHDAASVYVKPEVPSSCLPIFEFEDNVERKVADDFEVWLKESCLCARKRYSKKQWAAILAGPAPFTLDEKRILEARRRIHWQVVGIDEEGNHIFKVSNESDLTLPALTIGLRSKDGRLNGAVRLKVGHIFPGQTATLHVDCYKDLKPPQEIEAFELPEPRPEDREYYHEFRKAG